jgi:hypothetical protein
MGPCQELADDLRQRISGESAARPPIERRHGAPKGAARPAKGCAPHMDLRFSARHPPVLFDGSDQQSPDAFPRRGKEGVCLFVVHTPADTHPSP